MLYCKIRTTEDLKRRSEGLLVLLCLPVSDEITGDSILLRCTADGNEKVDTVC